MRLIGEVRAVHQESNGSAGARTIANIVTVRGIPLSRYRVGRLMKELKLVSCQLPNHRYNKAPQSHVVISNQLDRQFDVTRPNAVWCGDVTYIWAGHRWAYLAVVIGLYVRKPVGWAISLSPDSELTGKALTMSFEARGKPQGLMSRSDQGCHYTSRKFRHLLWRYKIKQSMSRRGNCWASLPHEVLGYNAPMERFFRRLKTEWIPTLGYQNFTEAKYAIRNYIVGYYSQTRPHLYNDGLSPSAAERKYEISY